MESNRNAWIGLAIFFGVMILAFIAVAKLEEISKVFTALQHVTRTSSGTEFAGGDTLAGDTGFTPGPRVPIPEEDFPQVAKRWNAAIGHDILGRVELWDEVSGSLAERLRLLPDTRTRHVIVYSSENSLPLTFNGSPTQMTLYATGRYRARELHIAYANRGTYPPSMFRRQLNSDHVNVGQTLVSLLGPAETRRVTGKDGVVQHYQQWVKDGMRIRFYGKENDYVAVSLTPAHAAAEPAPPGPEHWAKNVMRFSRGDVLIRDIPMIKQGHKPYCVPVTVERVLQYFQTPENMFALAAAGDVGHQGCSTYDIFGQADVRLAKQGLGIDFQRKRLTTVNDVKGSIDQGYPVIWLVRGYVNTFLRAKQRNGSRQSASDSAAWRHNVDSDRRLSRVSAGQYHSVLIVGYNAQSREIAIIDEIGLIWLTEEEVRRVSQPALMPIVRR